MSKYLQFEELKKELQQRNLSPEQYEQAIIKIIGELSL